VSWRDGYRVIRKAGRYLVFPRGAFSEMMGWHGGRDGLVEIWNGMPFFSPLWSRTAHVTWLHHVHAEMWQMTLPPRLAAFGNFVESKLAPPLYHRTPIVTLSESSKRELVDDLGFRADRVSVVTPGIDPHYTPGGEKSPTPLVVAVGRLVPVKQFDVLIDALVALKPTHPDLEAVIVGEGYKREELESQLHTARAESWIRLPGHVDEDEKVDLYRRAWILASASAREGWGMTITEAAACGTPAVVSDVAGHADAVVDGRTGVLAPDTDTLRAGLDRLLGDDDLRARMSAAAQAHASRYTWEATARGTLEVLAAASIARRGRRDGR
jgi:glycosyltransferase involved in cell wall biosynthesis